MMYSPRSMCTVLVTSFADAPAPHRRVGSGLAWSRPKIPSPMASQDDSVGFETKSEVGLRCAAHNRVIESFFLLARSVQQMILKRCTDPRYTERGIPGMKMTGIIASVALSTLSGCVATFLLLASGKGSFNHFGGLRCSKAASSTNL